MVDMMEDFRKMEIINNIHLLAQQLFQLIQQQKMEITINQQTIKYTNTKKRPWDKVQRKTENTIDKIMAKVKLVIETQPKVTQYQELNIETWNWWIQQFPRNFCYFYLGQHMNIQNLYTDKIKRLFDTTILQQLNNLWGKQFNHTSKNQPEILLNTKIDTVTVNQIRKLTNAQFEELQNKITQIILKKEIQKLLKNRELELGDLENLNRAQY
ncbi:hypothetical protein G9A89_011571 [Geosiphon pyriformis]|nr:hypothetical protein G9A89_011571 [Geosiphon pyriformis]